MSLTQEQIKSLKVGDTVFIASINSSSYESTVEKISKNYIYLECGLKIDTVTGFLTGFHYRESAVVYLNEQEYIERQTIEDVVELINREGLTYQQALAIKELLEG